MTDGPPGDPGASAPDDVEVAERGAAGRAGRWLLGLVDRRAGAAALVIPALIGATVVPDPTEAMQVARPLLDSYDMRGHAEARQRLYPD